MQDKDMINDTLSALKASLTGYSTTIAETDNQQLRQEIQQMRNNCETSQYDFYKLAKQKGFYKPAAQASPEQIQTVKSQVSGS
ncbi:spore coat protein [Clostridium sporogenes]|uniref:Coat F domain-containing protein n=3 Tax=Clostridia TaxID=186801 RepID=A0A7X5SWY0_CLOSG|nr:MULTISPECIES: spore coat protein [Clostridia]AJD32893.1 coat F domain protein [Clostridium botulinum Prevot_594]AVP61753.1 spore coat protein [Clostridium botulinum]AKC61547.1 coat F domain-containing protein [Clostridium sporogenes]AKJ88876.1 coat protein F [Clostridium sporogenes]AVP65354.1 spore coat protein [Clostridium botulinum]